MCNQSSRGDLKDHEEDISIIDNDREQEILNVGEQEQINVQPIDLQIEEIMTGSFKYDDTQGLSIQRA